MTFITPPQPSDGFAWTQAQWGPALCCGPLGRIATHLFTTANLRLADDPREWSAVAAEIGVDLREVRLIQQVHGVDVAVVRTGSAPPSGRPRADIIISDDPAVAIAVRVADCAPILLADRRLGVVGAVHAGWRGTARSVAGRAVAALIESFGSDPQDLIAAVGPCLGSCCGEMGPEVVDEFRSGGYGAGDLARWFTPGPSGRLCLNLWAANRDQLAGAGIPAPQIHVAAICTKSHSSMFHSYRAHGRRAGRMIGTIRASSHRGSFQSGLRTDRGGT